MQPMTEIGQCGEGLRHLPIAQLKPWTRNARSHSKKQIRQIADSKLALNAGWDEEILAEELAALMELDLGFDIGVTGFSIPEIDGLLEAQAPEEPGDPADDAL